MTNDWKEQMQKAAGQLGIPSANIQQARQQNPGPGGGGGGGGPSSRGPQSPRLEEGLPGNYLSNGYFDAQGNIWPSLIVEDAIARARDLGSTIKSTQLRRFFGRARYIEQKLNGTSFPVVIPELYQFEPMVAYAVGRGVAPPIFKAIIERNIQWAVTGEAAFRKGFLVHFESIVAYFTYLNPSSASSRR